MAIDFDEKDIDNIEFEDVENYRNPELPQLSHEALVMQQYQRVLKAGSQEMKKGWVEQKMDRIGNAIVVKVHPDTRQEFIESIETLKNLMIADIIYNTDIREAVKKLYEELKTIKSKWIQKEKEYWSKIPYNIKISDPPFIHVDGVLNMDTFCGEMYTNEKLIVYRKIFQQLEILLNITQYLQAKMTQQVPIKEVF